MRLAKLLLFAVISLHGLSLDGRTQTPRLENDPRNPAPTVGTGGSPGGPTGLFTIYDSQTLRRGEFTL